MPKKYSAEYRRRIVELVRSGRKVMDVSREFQIDHTTVRIWVRQAAVDDGTAPGLTSDEKQSWLGSGARTQSCGRSARS